MMVTARPVNAVDLDTFADITPTVVTGTAWVGGELQVTFADTLTALELAAVKRRMASRNANEEELRRLAEVALTNNRAYVAIPSPTQAQAGTQVQALTRQMNGVIRQLLGFLDGTD